MFSTFKNFSFSSLFDLEKVIDLIQNGEDREGRNLIILDDISHELKRDGQEIVKSRLGFKTRYKEGS